MQSSFPAIFLPRLCPCFAAVCFTRFSFCGVLKSHTKQLKRDSSKCCFKCNLSPVLVLKTFSHLGHFFFFSSCGMCSVRCLMYAAFMGDSKLHSSQRKSSPI